MEEGSVIVEVETGFFSTAVIEEAVRIHSRANQERPAFPIH